MKGGRRRWAEGLWAEARPLESEAGGAVRRSRKGEGNRAFEDARKALFFPQGAGPPGLFDLPADAEGLGELL